MTAATAIRVLTLRPELAWGLASGRLLTLRRRRPTARRGPVLLHAGPQAPGLFLCDGSRVPPGLPRLALLGAADLVACEPGRYDCTWVFAGARLAPRPVPCQAGPGLWTPRALTASCVHCFREHPLAALGSFVCRRCGRPNERPF